jgi:CMP-N-acetylneuraminic acid synthetase
MDNLVNTNNRILAVIPARGGSKRVPRKNILDFMGKPLIAWTIEAAQRSELFDKIVVSTDDQEIADISVKYGAEVPFLRDKGADDFAPVAEGTIRTIEQLEEIGEHYKTVMQLFAVCPVRDEKEMHEALHFFNENHLEFLISCYKYTWMNPWWAVTLNEAKKPSWIFEQTIKRSQDQPTLYSPTGAIWMASVEALKQSQNFYGPGHVFWPMDWKSAVDIDNYEDFELAEALYNIKNK